jgi:hypothetical protein
MASQNVAPILFKIRQSLTLLILKVVIFGGILTGVLISLYWCLFVLRWWFGIAVDSGYILMITSITLVLFGLVVGGYLVLEWLNEWYEISKEYIYHKKGIIFRRIEQYRIGHIRRIDMQDTLLGEMCHYATLSLYDYRLHPTLEMQNIDNPLEYIQVLKALHPNIEVEKEGIRIPILMKGDFDDVSNLFKPSHYTLMRS